MKLLAVGAVSLMHTIDPDVVLFGGGMIASGGKLLDDIRADVRALAFPTCAAKPLIEYAALGGDAGFIGDDLPDLPVLAEAGLAATVADARDEVKSIAHWTAPQPGGRGAVRAFAEFILRAQGVPFAGMTHG